MTGIWLQLREDQERALRAVVEQAAEENNTVPFQPHLTVCGVPDTNLGTVDAAAAYVKEYGLLPLIVPIAAVTGAVITPFRAVFIEVENTPELRQCRERLRDIVGGPELIPPHVSLLYTLDRVTQEPRGDFDPARLAAIAERCAVAIPDMHLTLERPIVNNSGGNTDVRSWRLLRAL